MNISQAKTFVVAAPRGSYPSPSAYEAEAISMTYQDDHSLGAEQVFLLIIQNL